MALKLAQSCALEYQSIDRDVRWLPGWQVRNREEQRLLLQEFVERDRWVMDGSGASTFDIRVPRAELIIWLRVPRFVAILGVAKRVVKNYGTVRVAIAEGCPEPFPDREFLSYIWNFERKSAPEFVKQIDRFGPNVPVTVLRSRREFDLLIPGT
ncbi:hypothetical protein [Albidovulum aquaemixtae]|uniref:hypothetical protein n=1 Tax=Albidovulum aquaemixtae TaxID=1542388 RepID=UPI001C62F25F|nr:hypothetical protein [Defluviimonas aquaemixtae]